MPIIRDLEEADRSSLDAFLSDHVETSLFLRSNLRSAGIDYRGAEYQGEYIAALDAAGDIRGVLVQYWNGNIMMQSPDMPILRDLLDHFKGEARRPVAGILGDNKQADYALSHLGLSEAAFAMNQKEELYSLDLKHLQSPPPPAECQTCVVEAKDVPKTLLTSWMKAYNIEALGAEDGDILEERVRSHVERLREGANCWVLLVDNQPVSLSAFNARLPDIVQIGPVWTPPDHRNNRFARYLLAETLKNARLQGVEKAILFTDEPAAAKAYQAIGFGEIGHFRLALLQQPMTLPVS